LASSRRERILDRHQHVLVAPIIIRLVADELMRQKLQQFVAIIGKDPAVDVVVGFTGGGQTNGGFIFMSLKPLSERKISADQVIRRLRGELAQVPGHPCFCRPCRKFA
jgi:multidrug efflux pump subunit AcrB